MEGEVKRVSAILVLVFASIAGSVGITAGATSTHQPKVQVTHLAGDVNPPLPTTATYG
jgi:hypothetical protein